jgi:asparagine N-glycosylation enzyme membrane subunit Stt3
MRYLVILVVLVLLIFFGLPDIVLFSKSGIVRWFPFIAIFFGIPFLLYKTLSDFKIRQDVALAISIGSVFIVGPLFGFWTSASADKDLDNHHAIKTGIVSEKWYATKHKSNTGEWLYKAQFQVDNKIYYTYTAVDEDDRVKIGDTVSIRYSRRNPENNEIVEK